jgi:hypothetical protein
MKLEKEYSQHRFIIIPFIVGMIKTPYYKNEEILNTYGQKEYKSVLIKLTPDDIIANKELITTQIKPIYTKVISVIDYLQICEYLLIEVSEFWD